MRIAADDLPRHFAIGAVARLDRDDVPGNRRAHQRQIADDVQNLVPDEFLRVAQRLGGQDGVVADDHGVFQAAALDQAVLDQVFDLLEKTKRPRMGQFALPGFRRHLEAVKLGEAPFGIRAGASDLQTRRCGKTEMRGVARSR